MTQPAECHPRLLSPKLIVGDFSLFSSSSSLSSSCCLQIKQREDKAKNKRIYFGYGIQSHDTEEEEEEKEDRVLFFFLHFLSIFLSFFSPRQRIITFFLFIVVSQLWLIGSYTASNAEIKSLGMLVQGHPRQDVLFEFSYQFSGWNLINHPSNFAQNIIIESLFRLHKLIIESLFNFYQINHRSLV